MFLVLILLALTGLAGSPPPHIAASPPKTVEKPKPAAKATNKPKSPPEQKAPSQSDLYMNTFDVSRDSCADAGPKGIAKEFGGNPADWDQVAQNYAREMATADHEEYAKLGCLQGFAER